MKNIIINLNKNNRNEIKNELTKFLDNYNIILNENDNDFYKDYCQTYIDIDKIDIKELLESNSENVKYLSFRIPGATRGAICVKEISRENTVDDKSCIVSIKYEICDIEFIESSCFTKLKVYSKDIIEASKEWIGSNIVINFSF